MCIKVRKSRYDTIRAGAATPAGAHADFITRHIPYMEDFCTHYLFSYILDSLKSLAETQTSFWHHRVPYAPDCCRSIPIYRPRLHEPMKQK